jgi:hypothetical protein
MAAQLRWLTRRGSLLREDELVLQHLAEQLERRAGSGAVLLSADCCGADPGHAGDRT